MSLEQRERKISRVARDSGRDHGIHELSLEIYREFIWAWKMRRDLMILWWVIKFLVIDAWQLLQLQICPIIMIQRQAYYQCSRIECVTNCF